MVFIHRKSIQLRLGEWLLPPPPPQYSCLENPMNRGAWRAPSSPRGRKESDATECLNFHFSFFQAWKIREGHPEEVMR